MAVVDKADAVVELAATDPNAGVAAAAGAIRKLVGGAVDGADAVTALDSAGAVDGADAVAALDSEGAVDGADAVTVVGAIRAVVVVGVIRAVVVVGLVTAAAVVAVVVAAAAATAASSTFLYVTSSGANVGSMTNSVTVHAPD